jgi:hypothetical protein
MSRLVVVTAATASLLLAGAGTASAKAPCVGPDPGCRSTIQAALDAASDGDVIKIAPGRYRGGVTVAKSVTLAGAGAGATTIAGGGPVVTIGEFLADHPPTVSISGVTITGGVSHSSALSEDGTGADGVIASGGGVEVNPGADYSAGATLTITDSVITGNRAAPTGTAPFGPTCPGGDPCPFAWARGAGIDTWGRLKLVRTTVSDNVAAGVASDTLGAGIDAWNTATLTLRDSYVTGNRALASAPNGRFAEGGGIFTEPGVELSIQGGSVSENKARLQSTLPYFVAGADPLDMNANGGGIHAGDGGAVTITGAALDDNVVRVDDPNGEPYAFDSALHPGDGPLVLRNVSMDGNILTARVRSSADVGSSGSAIDLNGPSTITGARITRNSTVVRSIDGSAEAAGAVYAGVAAGDRPVIASSLISGNTVKAFAAGGPALVRGAGLLNDGRLRLTGALSNSPPIELTLEHSAVTGNALTATAGLTVEGGGLFTAFPVSLLDTDIAGNTPGDCSGC